MIRIAWLFLLGATTMAAQSDSQTLQGILQELRQLRADMHGMTLVAQRVNILLYRIQLQDDATKKAAQRYDQVSARLRDAERGNAETADTLKTAEEKLAQNPNQRDQLEELVREMKRRIEMLAREETNYRAAEAAAGSDLRIEQAKLSDLQERLDRLEKQLENYATSSPTK